MTKPADLPLALSFVSNSPGSPTGYGVQAELLISKLLKHNARVAVQSNWGREGNIGDVEVAGKRIREYPKGFRMYSEDVIPLWHKHWTNENPKLKGAIFTLYDVWVYNPITFQGLYPEGNEPPIISWVPLDHLSLPPAVGQFLQRPNVIPITMAPHGQRQLEAAGIKSTYIPHAINTKLYKPTDQIQKTPARRWLGFKDSDYVVGIVAANKAAGELHRKAFAENLLAFSIFAKNKPGVKLYIHAEPSRVFGGFHLPTLLQALGITPEQVVLPEPFLFRIGYPTEDMAGVYSSLDVLMAASYGEGFGVCGIEAQACGTRVITSDFAATADLYSEDSWAVKGQAFWHESQAAFFAVPSVEQLVEKLELAYQAERGPSAKAVEFASQFDLDKVWANKWLPFWSDFVSK